MLHISIRRQVLTSVIIGVITAVIITPITLYIGYRLNDYWLKDKISIERVDIIPDTTKLPYPSKEIMTLYQNPRFDSYLLSRGYNIIHQFTPEFYNLPSRQFLKKKHIDEIITVLEDFLKFDKELQEKEHTAMQRLLNYDQGDNISDMFSIVRYRRINIAPFIASNDTEKVKLMLGYLKNEESYVEEANQYVDEILRHLKSFKPERTGMIDIKLTLLNTGNTDGLVKEDGELHVDGQTEPLRIIEKSVPDDMYDIFYVKQQFKTITKRSMVQKIFIINESRTAQGLLNEFKAMVQKGSTNQIGITLYDIRDDPIRSKDHRLPVIQE